MIPSTKVSDMMLRINWSQIKGLKEHLARQGFQPESELMVMTLFKKNIDSVRMRINISQLESYLFEIEQEPNLIGIFVLNGKNNRPLWSARAAERENSLETIPLSGHGNVVVEFKNMSPEQKQPWIDILTSAAQTFIDKDQA